MSLGPPCVFWAPLGGGPVHTHRVCVVVYPLPLLVDSPPPGDFSLLRAVIIPPGGCVPGPPCFGENVAGNLWDVTPGFCVPLGPKVPGTGFSEGRQLPNAMGERRKGKTGKGGRPQ